MAASVNLERAIALLGKNIPAVQVAAACACTESYISQLLAQPAIYERVVALRYEALSAATNRDAEFDRMEDMLIKQLQRSIPTIMKPMEALKALQTVNGLKRRGVVDNTESGSMIGTSVVLNMPTVITKNFTVNVHNQVVGAGSQDLVTATLGSVAGMATAMAAQQELAANDLGL